MSDANPLVPAARPGTAPSHALAIRSGVSMTGQVLLSVSLLWDTQQNCFGPKVNQGQETALSANSPGFSPPPSGRPLTQHHGPLQLSSSFHLASSFGMDFLSTLVSAVTPSGPSSLQDSGLLS